MQPQHDNSWNAGKQPWDVPPMPPWMAAAAGVFPVRGTLDPRVGTEVVLYLLDPTPFIFEIVELNPFELHLKTGIVRTRGGPVIFLLWWLRSPRSDEPCAMFESTLNPHDESHLTDYRELARQTHWHVFVIAPGPKVLDMYEFENEFGLGDALHFAVESSARFPCIDFDAAKAEYQDKYSTRELFDME